MLYGSMEDSFITKIIIQSGVGGDEYGSCSVFIVKKPSPKNLYNTKSYAKLNTS